MATSPRLALLLVLALTGCAGSPSALDEAIDETGFDHTLEPTPDELKADIGGSSGPTIRDGSATEVWAATRSWTDVTDEAGIAWEAGSGLTWEEKYDAWIASFHKIPRGSYGETFEIKTPFGDRTFPAPNLECAEVAYTLRATFASWYNLPFFIQGWDSETRQPMFAGHFGFVDRSGNNVARFPHFKTSYRDYTSSWSPGDAWPSDSALRRRHLGDDDGNHFLDGEGAGAYFDEIFLNKRVGHFLRLLLVFFGSINLADPANTFNLVPEAIAPGDTLLERWQRRGIGHTIPVMRVEAPVPGFLAVDIATGSMPRRQPVWEGPASARRYFTSEETGGEGQASDGSPYWQIGGGLKRWRTAVRDGSRWRNTVLPGDRGSYVDATDEEGIKGRPERFRQLLADVPFEQKLEVLQQQIDNARMHLRMYPASCAARTRREEAFEELYTLLQNERGETRAQVDATYRTLEDYVLAELEYEQSRTCCWNHSTAAMFEIIMAYAEREQSDAMASGMCVAPTVFRSEDGDYARWRTFAESIGRGAEWNAWSEDESCAQRNNPTGTLTGVGGVAWCDRGSVEPPPEPTDACDPETRDDSRETATPLTGTLSARICGDDTDFYRIEGDATVRIRFHHADGDLDMRAYDESGTEIGSSTGTSDTEEVSGTGTFYVEVLGYGGAQNSYFIDLVR